MNVPLTKRNYFLRYIKWKCFFLYDELENRKALPRWRKKEGDLTTNLSNLFCVPEEEGSAAGLTESNGIV